MSGISSAPPKTHTLPAANTARASQAVASQPTGAPESTAQSAVATSPRLLDVFVRGAGVPRDQVPAAVALPIAAADVVLGAVRAAAHAAGPLARAATKPSTSAAASPVAAAEVKRNLDAIKLTQTNEGMHSRGNAVELNKIIPSNIARAKPPKGQIYAPLRKAVDDKRKAQGELAKATTDKGEAAAQKKIAAADERIQVQGTKLKKWMKDQLHTNPEVRGAKAKRLVAERALAKLERAEKKKPGSIPDEKLTQGKSNVTEATKREADVRAALEKRIDAYQPEVQVPQVRSDVTVGGTTVRMRDSRETPYTNSWQAVDGGSTTGDSREIVNQRLAESGISSDRQKILGAISEREGTFSKVNTWDTGRVSWGFTQWTLGKSGNGSLADFMRHAKKKDPALFRDQFQKHGIDVDKKGSVLTRPDGAVLRGVEAAEAMRSDPKLAGVFMAAGANADMQQLQIQYANDGKITGTRAHKVTATGKDKEGAVAKGTLRVGDVVTSEYGNAVLADLSVNAGSGHRVAAAAIQRYVEAKGVDPTEPASWAKDGEKAVIAALEQASRKERVKHMKEEGFSREPGSFTP